MVNEERIKLLYKLALYEKNEDEKGENDGIC